MEAATIFETIHRVLAPYVGTTMAAASTRVHCEKLGISLDGGTLTDEQVQTLIGKLGAGLVVFIGREKAAGVVEEIRRAVGAGGPR
jgi:hypothetical protein